MHAKTYLLTLFPLLSAASPLGSPQVPTKMPGKYPPPQQCWIDNKCDWDPITGEIVWLDLPIERPGCWRSHTCDPKGNAYTRDHPAPCSWSGWCNYLGNRVNKGGAHIAIPTSEYKKGVN
jgi:hypothetical protein